MGLRISWHIHMRRREYRGPEAETEKEDETGEGGKINGGKKTEKKNENTHRAFLSFCVLAF